MAKEVGRGGGFTMQQKFTRRHDALRVKIWTGEGLGAEGGEILVIFTTSRILRKGETMVLLATPIEILHIYVSER